jgi:PAS domain S-box-containing protein
MNDHQKTQEQLLEELAELRQRVANLQECQQQVALLQSVPLGIHVCDNDGRITFVNSAQERITGYSADELVGTYIWDRAETGAQKDLLPAYLRQLVSDQPHPTPYSAKNIRKNGEIFDVRIDWNYIRNPQGQVTGFVSVVSDITEQQNSDAALLQSEERYRTLAEATTDVVYIVDKDGTLLYANQIAAAYMRLPPSALVGKEQQDLFSPETATFHVERLRQVFETGEVGEDDELLHFGSEEVWLNIRSIPIRDEQGRITSVMGVCRNITDRKQAEEALKNAHDELEQQVAKRTADLTKANEDLSVFRTLAEASGQGFGIADLDGRITYANMALHRLIGHGDPLGQSIFSQVPEDHRRQLQEEGLPAVLRDGHWESEWTSRSTSGEEVVTLNSIFLLRDKAGNPAYLADVVTDITERKQAEQALEHAHGQLQAIYEGMADGLLIADVETKEFMRANTSICRMLGYSEEELLSKSVRDIHPPADLAGILESFQALADGCVRVGANIPVLRKDGSTFFADIVTNTLDYNGRLCLTGFFRDITEKKRAEEALRQSHDELRAIYDQIADGIVIVDADKVNPVRANSAYCLMLGYSEEEAYSLTAQRVHPPEALPRVWEYLDAVKQGIVARIEDLPFVRKDGSILYADVVSSQIHYNDRPGWISFFHDVTERKQAHETLQQQHETLKHLLQSSDHERQLIAYDIHDGMAQQLAGAIMQFQIFDHLKDKNRKEASKAYDAGSTMLRQSLFEARRLIAGVRPPILDESGVVEAIAHLVHEQARATKQKIDFHSSVDFDRLAPTLENTIYRIAQEGLTNACKHSKTEKVRVSFLQHGDELRIEILDWGIGFDPKAVPKSRFGLEGIRQRARLLGGKCSIRSSPGKGTRITVELPVVLRE